MKKLLFVLCSMASVPLYSSQPSVAPRIETEKREERENRAALIRRLSNDLFVLGQLVAIVEDQVLHREPLIQAADNVFSYLDEIERIKRELPYDAVNQLRTVGLLKNRLERLVQELFEILTRGVDVVSRNIDRQTGPYALNQQMGDITQLYNVLAAHLSRDADYHQRLLTLRGNLFALRQRMA